MPDGSQNKGVEGFVPARRTHAEVVGAVFDEVVNETPEQNENQTERDLSKDEDFIDIREAGEDHVLEQWYDWDEIEEKLIIYYTEDSFADSEGYKAIENLEQSLESAGARLEDADDAVKFDLIEEIQGAYDATKQTLRPRAERTVVEVFSEAELQHFGGVLNVLDSRVEQLLTQLVAIENSTEAVIYKKRLEEIAGAVASYKEKINPNDEVLLSESHINTSYTELESFVAQIDITLEQIATGIETVANPAIKTVGEAEVESKKQTDSESGPEPVQAEAVEKQKDDSFADTVFAQVDRNPSLRAVERGAAHELLRQYESASEDDRMQIVEQYESLMSLIGIAPPDPERIRVQSGHLLADVEIEIGSSHSDIVQQARSLREEILELTNRKPSGYSQVDQLLAEKLWQKEVITKLKELQQVRDSAEMQSLEEDIAQKTEGLPVMPSVYKLQPEKAVALRKKLTLEDIGGEGVLQIDTSKLEMAEDEEEEVLEDESESDDAPEESLQNLLREYDQISLESSYSDNSLTIEADNSQAVDEAEQSDTDSKHEENVKIDPQRIPIAGMVSPMMSSRRQKTTQEALQIRLQKEISAIERRGVSRFDLWLGEDVPSAYEQIGHMQFTEFEALTEMPHAARMDVLRKRGVNPGVFQQWDAISEAMKAHVPDYERKTFKQVVDQYVQSLSE